jgi:hypothetical protein
MDLFEAQGIPSESVEWDADRWLPHFDALPADGRKSCYVFDFAAPPKVRGDSSGFVDAEGRLWVVAETPCPECSRPTTVLFRRWNNEKADERNAIVNARMQEINWHALHPQRKRRQA